MKNIKKILLVASILLLCGCSSAREAINGDTFASKMIEANYSINDYKDTYGYAESAYLINQDNIYMLYVKGNKSTDIEGIFVDECDNIYKAAGSDYEDKIKGGSNWTSLEIITKDTYYYISWIDDTYIYVKADIDKKNTIKDLIKEIGY